MTQATSTERTRKARARNAKKRILLIIEIGEDKIRDFIEKVSSLKCKIKPFGERARGKFNKAKKGS